MKRVFISADIEGTCGIASWKETDKDHSQYPAFARQMSLEVAAACEGALAAGAEYILVRDAHDSARNIDANLLPREVELVRGWAGDPQSMMSGIDQGFSAAIFTGYHDAAGSGANPLSHTMSTSLIHLHLNGQLLSEAQVNAYTAAHYGVPLAVLTGDQGICQRMQGLSPGLKTVAVNTGTGNAVRSIHPQLAIQRIRETVEQALLRSMSVPDIKLPEHFILDVRYREHSKAFSASFYPGVTQLDSHTIRFETDDWLEVLRMKHFCF